MGVKVYEIQDRHVQPFYVTKNWFVYFFKREMFNLRKSIKVLILKYSFVLGISKRYCIEEEVRFNVFETWKIIASKM